MDNNKNIRQGRLALIIILSVLVIDQIIKILVKTGMSLGESIDVTSCTACRRYVVKYLN